jgi:uncharacterized protein
MTTKEIIVRKIREHKQELSSLGIRRIGLFGSYLYGAQTPKSDIDILVDFSPEKENFDNLMAVCDLLEGLFRSEKVEVITENGMSPYIGPKILSEVEYV